MAPTLAGLIILICVLAITAAITYGCQDANTRYYDAMRDCIGHGGTFIPTGMNSDAACVAAGREIK